MHPTHCLSIPMSFFPNNSVTFTEMEFYILTFVTKLPSKCRCIFYGLPKQSCLMHQLFRDAAYIYTSSSKTCKSKHSRIIQDHHTENRETINWQLCWWESPMAKQLWKAFQPLCMKAKQNSESQCGTMVKGLGWEQGNPSSNPCSAKEVHLNQTPSLNPSHLTGLLLWEEIGGGITVCMLPWASPQRSDMNLIK